MQHDLTREVTLLRDGSLWIADDSGDVTPTPGQPRGLFVGECRLVSRWELTLRDADELPGGPTAIEVTPSELTVVAVPRAVRDVAPATLLHRHQRVDRDGLTETIAVRNATDEPRRVCLLLRFEADFADQFLLRVPVNFDLSAAHTSAAATADGLRLTRTHRRRRRIPRRRTAVHRSDRAARRSRRRVGAELGDRPRAAWGLERDRAGRAGDTRGRRGRRRARPRLRRRGETGHHPARRKPRRHGTCDGGRAWA